VVKPAVRPRRRAGTGGLPPSWQTADGPASCDLTISVGGRGRRASDETEEQGVGSDEPVADGAGGGLGAGGDAELGEDVGDMGGDGP
jgi:hypothetical protein